MLLLKSWLLLLLLLLNLLVRIETHRLTMAKTTTTVIKLTPKRKYLMLTILIKVDFNRIWRFLHQSHTQQKNNMKDLLLLINFLNLLFQISCADKSTMIIIRNIIHFKHIIFNFIIKYRVLNYHSMKKKVVVVWNIWNPVNFSCFLKTRKF